MTADPQDIEPQDIKVFRIKVSGEDEFGKFRQLEKELIIRHEAPAKRRQRANEQLASQLQQKEEELKQRERDLHTDRRQLGGLGTCTKCQSKDDNYRDAGYKRAEFEGKWSTSEAALMATTEKLAEQSKLRAQLAEETSLLSAKMVKLNDKVRHQQGAIERQMAKALQKQEQLKQARISMVGRETYDDVLFQLEAAQDLVQSMNKAAEELAWEKENVEEKLAQATAGPGRGRHAVANAVAHNDRLKEDTGLRVGNALVPLRLAETTNAEQLSVRHMAAVLQGRGEGDNINLIADALQRAGYLERLLHEADRVQPLVKGIVKDVVNNTQKHWSSRHAVHVWDRLELSRSQMETLRHLLSYVYDAATDGYVPIKAWVNPADDGDFVLSAVLAGRTARETEFNKIAATMNIVVGANGRCERDAIECTSRLYSNFIKALRSNFSNVRPAQPILFLDGTGGALGRGICHGEMGCADFTSVGDCDTKQSRASLQPLFLYEGNDHAKALRDNLDLAMTSYNKLVANGCFDRRALDGQSETIPARAMTAADMQGAKTTYGMRECSHSVWCKCQRGEGGPQHRYPTEPVETYDEMLKYIKDVGCTVKTFDDLCSWAHYSPGVAKGGSFTAFECSCCGYKPSEKQWRSDLAKWHGMADAERDEERKVHHGADDELNTNHKHYHQELYMPPLPHHGMDRCGVDNLHLIYLNLFKHLFKYTIHEGLPLSKKKLVRDFCKAAGFYSYDASSDDEDPVKHWIGREVKRFIEKAEEMVPFLLQIASAPAECIPGMAAVLNGEDEMEMEEDDAYAPSADDIAEEEKEEPLMMQNADRWDHFFALVEALSRPWPQGEEDTDEYRKARAVEVFNLGAQCANDILALKPTMLTWVPHILVFIVPLQMVYLGDPTRRSADACESFGAMVKKVIKHTTCRRRRSTEALPHASKKSGKIWKQTFRRGYIEQAFRRVSVRESLQHGLENAPYVQRADVRRTSLGKASVYRKMKPDAPTPSTMRQLCDEFGAPTP